MDSLTISRFIVPIRIGHKAEERTHPQRVRIDLLMRTDFTAVLESSDLEMGIDYSNIRRSIKEIASSQEFVLLESLGDMILRAIFEDRKILSAKIAIRKLDRWEDAVPGVLMTRRNE